MHGALAAEISQFVDQRLIKLLNLHRYVNLRMNLFVVM